MMVSFKNSSNNLLDAKMNKVFRIKDSIFFHGEINSKNTNLFVRLINEKKINNIYLNTNGGCVYNTICMLDHINFNRFNKKINLTISGNCFSAGTLILAGINGERIMTSNSILMYHRTMNNLFEVCKYNLDAESERVRILEEIERNIYFKRKFDEEFYNKFDKSNLDIYLKAEEALSLGLIDKIV